MNLQAVRKGLKMENVNLVIVDNNLAVSSSIKKYLEVKNEVNVVACIKDGEEALEYLVNHQNDYDVIILDLVLPKIDGISLLENIKRKDINKKIIVLSGYKNDNVSQKLSNLNVDYYMIKPFSLESLWERLKDLYKFDYFESNKQINIEIEISDLLHNLGIPSHVRGYQYIRDGVLYLYNKNGYVSYITKEIYPEIAEKYDTTSSRVERAIRHAIEISWDRGDLNLMENLFGHSIDYERSKPTNSEYINTIADRVKLNNRLTV